MMSDPAEVLYQKLSSNMTTPEHLEVLGKHAATRWCSNGGSLTDAVVDVVKHAHLLPEQIRRVIEFANVEAFQNEFRKEGAHKFVDFSSGPADPAEVFQNLNQMSGTRTFDRGVSDYNQPREGSRVKSASAEAALEELFAVKEASLPEENPFGDALDLRDKLATVVDHMTAQIGGLEIMFGDLSDRLYQEVKQASFNGVSMGELAEAWSTVTNDGDFLKVAFQYVTPRLLDDGVFPSLDAMQASVEKTAGARVVNPQHPLVTEFAEFCESLAKIAQLRQARDEAAGHLQELNGFMKQALQEGLVPKAMRAYNIAQRGAGHLAHGGAELLMGKGHPSAKSAKDYGEKLVRYGIPAAGLSTAYLHAMYNPTIAPVVNTGLSMVPGTSEWEQRKYQIASGQ